MENQENIGTYIMIFNVIPNVILYTLLIIIRGDLGFISRVFCYEFFQLSNFDYILDEFTYYCLLLLVIISVCDCV